jgi:glutamate dehydrogenase (NAD(P)+)
MHNAHRFNCKIIAEAANGPTTIKGEQICLNKGIHFFPDILVNAGGVTCSYFEWIKNLEHMRPGRLVRKWQEKSSTGFVDIIS